LIPFQSNLGEGERFKQKYIWRCNMCERITSRSVVDEKKNRDDTNIPPSIRRPVVKHFSADSSGIWSHAIGAGGDWWKEWETGRKGVNHGMNVHFLFLGVHARYIPGPIF